MREIGYTVNFRDQLYQGSSVEYILASRDNAFEEKVDLALVRN
jgi:hypothetical protein